MQESFAKFGNAKHDVTGEFSASVVEDGLFWDLTLGSANQEFSLLLNCIELNESKYPNQLVRLSFDSADAEMDHGEHGLLLSGQEMGLSWFTLSFSKWDSEQQ